MKSNLLFIDSNWTTEDGKSNVICHTCVTEDGNKQQRNRSHLSYRGWQLRVTKWITSQLPRMVIRAT